VKTLTFIIVRTNIRIIWRVPKTVIKFLPMVWKSFLVESNFINYKSMSVRFIPQESFDEGSSNSILNSAHTSCCGVIHHFLNIFTITTT
jgi:hypothetical protein